MSLSLLQSSVLVQQGAEARVYKGTLHPGQPQIILKHRFKKQYRHPTLDNGLTKSRVAMEARALMRCLRNGVSVPGLRMMDPIDGVLGVELIDGPSVRTVLGGGADGDIEGGEEDDDSAATSPNESVPLNLLALFPEAIMKFIGRELAKMHAVDIIHGDLTTSNMMLRRSPSTDEIEVVLIDFGLSYQSALVEDKAVDLYVLERAFASTHPESEPLFATILDTYAGESGKAWAAVKRRLDDVRLRGRKRSMVG
ncbi:serine/threonine-protein kinase bud32 [Tulasnella sp. 427]|nr:serine/threonine-protein kinase bud32 [Tulasnella sp. 427]